MALPGNGIFVVQGEMSTLMTAMKRGARWSSNQDEPSDSVLKGFVELKELLNKVEDLRLLDPVVFLDPFLQVIRSEETTGPVTSLALAAVNKFLSYGLIDPTHALVPATVESVADAVTHARFVGTDQASDGAVLMEILQVLRTLMLSPEGAMLSNESVCEIMLSCFRICFESRLTELLRRTAKHCLRDMVQLLFMRLPQFAEDVRLSLNIKKLKMRANNMDKSRGGKRSNRNVAKNKTHNRVAAIKTEVPETLENDTPMEDGMITPTGLVPPNRHKAHPLSTTPMTPAGNIVDLHSGSISQGTPNSFSISTDKESTPETNGTYSTETMPANTMQPPGIIISVESPLNSEPTKPSEEQPLIEDQHDDVSNVQQELDSENFQKTNAQIDPESSLSNAEGEIIKTEVVIDAVGVEVSVDNCTAESEHNNSLETDTASSDYVNQQGVRFTSISQTDSNGTQLVPYGLPCVRELFRFLISLCNPSDQQNSELMMHTGLSLLTVAFEVAADSVGKYTALLSLVRDDLCKNLFALLNSERLSIFAADLQVCFLLFESLRSHLKFQLEYFLKKLTDIIISESPRVSYEQKEIALDSIVQLYHIPGLVTELYLNYDCDMYSSNLFEDLTKLLSKNAFPISAGVYNTHLLSLDALLTIISSIENNCLSSKINDKQDLIAVDELHQENHGDGKDEGSVVENINTYINSGKSGRQKVVDNPPSYEDLMIIKNKKRWLATGTELFNSKPEKGIQFLQEHNILSTPLDPLEVAHFLRENPLLDKKMIGEYISRKKNVESRILEVFVGSFDFSDIRVDEALRLYLETFRLPGEAPLIFLVMEHFADHWHKCNNEPFANTDAAFRLAYAIIMLNMDQHNHNAKRLNIPMTAEDFMKNLRGLNGNADFDQEMLLAVYNSIKNEEIIMPAEQTGSVRENYLWKVLLRRGMSRDGHFLHVPNGSYDKDLFALIWGPTVAALSFVFDKSYDANIYQRAIEGFNKCAIITAYYNLTSDFDTLVVSLCKFTTLVSQNDSNEQLSVSFGQNAKAQLAARTVFNMAHSHGDIMREGWKNILEVIWQLYKSKLLPKVFLEAEDFCEPNGKISLIRETKPLPRSDAGIFSSLYSYLSSETGNQRLPTQEEQEFIKKAKACIRECNLDQLITESKFLQMEALQELVKALIAVSNPPEGHKSLGIQYDEDSNVFFLELLIKVMIQNRDRVLTLWQLARDHLYVLIMGASSCDYPYLLTRAVTGLLRLAICLMRNEDMAPVVLQSLRMLLLLKPTLLFRISKQISKGLYELLKTSAQNIHTEADWDIIFTLLECVGAGAIPPKIFNEYNVEHGAKSDGALSSEEESLVPERGYTSDSELTKPSMREPLSPKHGQSADSWILVNKESTDAIQSGHSNHNTIGFEVKLLPHSPLALVKCWESLAFIVRDVAHITPYNFPSCIRCIRTFVEATLHGNIRRKPIPKDPRNRKKNARPPRRREQSRSSPSSTINSGEDSSDSDELPDGYQLIAIQLLDLMHTLHTRTAQIFRWWAEEGAEPPVASLWNHGWKPLLQGISRLCCDNRKQVRTSAVTYLQRALLVHDLQTLTASEWESCFNAVLFPLLRELLPQHNLQMARPADMEEVRIRAATIMSKVFLHHLTPLLSLDTFTELWMTILDFFDCYMKSGSDYLNEAVLESLKNILLVMHSVKVFHTANGYSPLWDFTWNRINTFLPNLKEDLFKGHSANEISDQPQEIPQQLKQSPPPNMTPQAQPVLETYKPGSIILQPPSAAISSPLFSHLGQMVSTPIGAPNSLNQSVTHQGQYPMIFTPSEMQNLPQVSMINQHATPYAPQLCNVAPPVQLPFQYYKNPAINFPDIANKTIEFTESVPEHAQSDSVKSTETGSSFQQSIANLENQNSLLGNTNLECQASQSQIVTGHGGHESVSQTGFVNAVDSHQPMSIYSEYISNPYNHLQGMYNNQLLNLDPNLNYSHNLQIQQNETCNSNDNSPCHAVDNLKQDALPYNLTSSNLLLSQQFQTSNYFTAMSDHAIPPGSEILFGVGAGKADSTV